MRQSATEYRPQVIPTPRPLIAWLLTAAVTLFVVSLIVVAPLAAAGNHDNLAGPLYHSFGLLCHQIPERSFFIAGEKFAVCSRCTGVYFGFLAMLLVYPKLKSLRRTDLPSRKWLIASAVPLVIDFGLTFLGIWENTHATRFMTGLALGAAVVFFVMPGIVELSLRGFSIRST